MGNSKKEKGKQNAAMIRAGYLRCISCGDTKPLSEFSKKGGEYKDGTPCYNLKCNKCHYEYMKKYAAQKKAKKYIGKRVKIEKAVEKDELAGSRLADVPHNGSGWRGMIRIIRAEIDRLEDRFQQIETVVHD